MYNEKMPQNGEQIDVFGELREQVEYNGGFDGKTEDKINSYRTFGDGVVEKKDFEIESDNKVQQPNISIEREGENLSQESIQKIRDLIHNDSDDPFSLNDKIEQISKEMRKN